MIGRIEVLLRRLRRWLSRSEWAVRLLRMPRGEGTAAARGLLILQIDGLSRTQLERAVSRGRMPFLQRLQQREGYRLHSLYSGLPSSTPAVQAELFYGVKGLVPAFSFRDGATGRVVRMYEADPVNAIEDRLQCLGRPLLADGAAYFDIFAGGATEKHFCPGSVGWGPLLRGANPLALAFVVAANAFSVLRLATLLVLEFALATYDFLRGVIAGRDFLAELKFVPARIAISVLLRDLVRIGVEMDLARGLPVIHANFVGYDEQAHRRGPSSAFAHWSLKGIDDALARLWRAAKRSGRRDYDVWIYADHGQEGTLSYPETFGRTIEEAVATIFDELEAGAGATGEAARGIQSQRARLLGTGKGARLLPVYQAPVPSEHAPPLVVAMGPIGFVYPPQPLTTRGRDEFVRRLIEQASVPMVLAADGPDEAIAWTAAGEHRLPDAAAALFGADHPFLDEVARDLIALCAHPDAGALVISGWRPDATPYSFPVESGAHAGPGREETRAFALLPADTPLGERTRDYLRPLDLRLAAFNVLGGARWPNRGHAGTAPGGRPRAAGIIRLMTYNVHSCIGMDGRSSPERIARLIARYEPDIVALQELDLGRARSGAMDQARQIAHLLEMEYHFHATLRVAEEEYGNAVLTHLPMRPVRAGPLPRLANCEPRGALWVAVDAHGTEIQVLNTHLSLWPKERRLQARELAGETWLGHPDCRSPAVLIGDFNALPGSAAYRVLRTHLRDAQSEVPGHRPQKTLFGRYPSARIDHVFVDHGAEVIAAEVPRTQLANVASDHLPLIVDLRLPSGRDAAVSERAPE